MKDLKISKELFNEVTNSKCHEVFIKDEFIIAHSNLGMKMVNIYEFVFMCKEWVNKQEYWANSGYDNKYYCMLRDMPDNQWFYADTEVEAIFKACEWVLSEINK